MNYTFLNCSYQQVVVNATVNSTFLTTPMDKCVGDRLAWAVGDPLFTAALLVGFVGVFVMMQDTRLDVKIAVMIPVVVIAAVLSGLNWLFGLTILALALILMAILLKIFNR